MLELVLLIIMLYLFGILLLGGSICECGEKVFGLN
jgi:hypothetical protein